MKSPIGMAVGSLSGSLVKSLAKSSYQRALIFTTLAFFATASGRTVHGTAIPIIAVPVGLGPTGIVNGIRIASATAPNLQFQGQNVALDFNFGNGEFIRLFTATTFFQMDAFFGINNAPLPQEFSGRGYLTDKTGSQLGPAVTLDASAVTNGVNEIGVDLVLGPLTSNVVPADAYGVHLDLTLPDSPGFGFASSPSDTITFFGDIFGIGPGVQADVIPDGGPTLVLLGIGLIALMGVSRVAAVA